MAMGTLTYALLDISRAFDRVWHEGQLLKLSSFEFYLTLVSWMSCFYSKRIITVRVDGVLSQLFTVNANVRQSSILALILLSLINDLVASISNAFHCFTVDVTLHCFLSYSFTHQATTNIYQEFILFSASTTSDFGRISALSSTNHVRFIPSKASSLSIARKHRYSPQKNFDSTFPRSTELLLLLDVSLNSFRWCCCVNNRSHAAQSCVFYRTLGTFYILPPASSTQSPNPPDIWILQPCVGRSFVYPSFFWSDSTESRLFDQRFLPDLKHASIALAYAWQRKGARRTKKFVRNRWRCSTRVSHLVILV